MRHRSYFFRFAAFMMACLMCAMSASAYDMYLDGIYYTKLTNSTVEVSYANISTADYSGSVTVPTLAKSGIQSWTVKGIGYKAFGECSGLTAVTLPTSLDYVGDLAFIRCTSLSEIEIPENVTWIGTNAFEQCTSLGVVSLPSTLTSIGSVAFTDCDNISYIYSQATEPPTLGMNVFTNATYSNAYLLVPNSVSKEKYQAAPGWSNFSRISAISYYTFEKDGIYYCQTGPNTVAVCAKDANYNTYRGYVTIPKSVVYDYHGYTVNEVASNAFRDCPDLYSVSLPETVGVIGDFAFANCPNLTSVSFAGNSMLTEIGNNAFVSSGLTSFEFPESLTKIGNYAFGYCNGLTTITIPDKVTTVGAAAFISCTGLTTVNIGKGCTSLGEWCFMECNALRTVTSYAPTPPAISYYTFRNNSGFTTANLRMLYSSYDAYTSATYWSNFTTVTRLGYDFKYNNIYYRYTGSNTVGVAYEFPGSNTYNGSISVPSQAINDGITYSVTSVCGEAFYGNSLSSVTLPSTITRIEYNAFYRCGSLTQITIPSSVNFIGSQAFNSCSGLTKVNITNLAAWLGIQFANETANPLKQAHVLTLNNSTVSNLTIPSSITQLKQYAMVGCTTITSVTLHDNVTSVGVGAFKECTNLRTLSIGAGVTSINGMAFNGCSSLNTIYSNATTPPSLVSNTFDSGTYSGMVYVPNYHVRDAYLSAPYWQNFTNIFSLMDYDFEVNGIYYMITSTADNKVGVSRKNYLEESYTGNVVIPETVTYAGTTYTVTSLAANAFTEAPNLTGLTIPATVTNVNQAFFNNMATGLTSITCLAIVPPLNMTHMTTTQYANVTVTVPKNSVEAYQADAGWGRFANIVGMSYDFKRGSFFYEITGTNQAKLVRENENSYKAMTSVSIPSSVTLAGVNYAIVAIGDHAFYQCTNLRSVSFPNSITEIGNYAFYNCSGLTGNLALNEGLTTLGNYSFAYCTGITTAVFPVSITSIGDAPFAFCNSLTAFTRQTQPSNAPYKVVDGVVFSGKGTARTTLNIFPGGKSTIYTIPTDTKIIGPHAFRGSIVKTVNMPITVTTIHAYAFANCTALTDMNMSNGLKTIDGNAFSNCTAMTSVVLPSTLESLGARAFYNDNNLTTIECEATTPPACEVTGIGSNVSRPFDNIHFQFSLLIVPAGCKAAYQAANTWKLFANIIERSTDTIRGDVNGDGNINISDVTSLIDYLLTGNASGINLSNADSNTDGNVNISDVTALIDYLLTGSWS